MEDNTTPNAKPSTTAIVLSTIDSLWDRHDEQQAKIDRLQAAGDVLAERVQADIAHHEYQKKLVKQLKAKQFHSQQIKELTELLTAWTQAKEMR